MISAVVSRENGVKPKPKLVKKAEEVITDISSPESEKAIFPLVGKELLQEVKAHSELSPKALAKRCGYHKTSDGGKIRVNTVEFYNALLEAKGLFLGEESNEGGAGRKANYEVSLQANGSLLVGGTYTKLMGLEPGAKFEVKVGRKKIQLVLKGDNGESDDE